MPAVPHGADTAGAVWPPSHRRAAGAHDLSVNADDLPPPPRTSFASDNAAGVAGPVMDALAAANDGAALAYGEDDWTRRAEAAIDELFGGSTRTLLCWGGTGANVVGLGALLQPWQAVITPASAHIVVDECGAPVRFTGASILPVDTPDGRLRAGDLDPYLDWLGVEHHPQPAVVSVSQATEMGTVHPLDELADLCDHAHRSGLLVHLDGARLANALVALGVDARSGVREVGVDVVTFGLTKNGAMYGEAVVFLRPELAERAAFVRKQAGQLASKSRFIAAQLLALLDGDRWLDQARHANEMARLLAERLDPVPGVDVVRPPEVNAVFARVPDGALEELQRWSFFWAWDRSASLVRWMTSFATTPEDVERFAAGVAAIVAGADAA
jgi:threonine aldolase